MSDAALSLPAVEMAPARPAIEVENLWVAYRLRVDRTSLRSTIRRVLSRAPSPDRLVPAVQGVTFTVPRGQVLAVVGRNGAGKSTLLRALAGILVPEEGRVVVRGRLNMLAPGIGFDANLTGRENIILGGLAAGLDPQLLGELVEEIADFAQLGEYIKYPMRMYSAGMRARLAFAVAANLDPEILLIDEALAGGDAAFAEKSKDKMAKLIGEGRTIVIVTHGLSSVRSMATMGMWMHQGRIEYVGEPEEAVARYLRYCRLEHLDEMPDDL